MAATTERDIAHLKRKDLLDDYFTIAKRRKGALVATALRTRSVSMRDILAHGGTFSNSSSEMLKDLLLSGGDISHDIADIDALEELGRLVLLQNLLEGDGLFGERLLFIAHGFSSSRRQSPRYSRLLIQHLILKNDYDKASEILDQNKEVDKEFFGYLRAEFENPFTHLDKGTNQTWLANFNRHFLEYNLSPILIEENSAVRPFDRIKSFPDHTIHGDELVSVVLTAFRPDETRLTTSVCSILNQTWKHLELIIVNDGSGPEYSEIFKRISKLDTRIKIIDAPFNQGTYIARNIGYAASRGEFIAGQDDDDWSHPERIERQVKYLRANPNSIGCRVNGVMCNEYLNRVRLGYKPVGPNASSLLIRRNGYDLAGGYLEARKAADTEYFYRLPKVTGLKIGTLAEPLSIIRILPKSLSRSDFGPGWRHSSRRAFRSSYEYWHKNTKNKDLCVDGNSSVAVKVPRRFSIRQRDKRPEFDVVFAGDWKSYGGPQKSMLEEIFALRQRGYKVAIMDLEAGRFMKASDRTALNEPIQALINDGEVDQVLYDEHAYTQLLILRYPPILQFFTHDVSKMHAKCMVILANQAPSESDGSDIRYIVADCHKTAKVAFGVTPVWIPQGPQIRKFLELYLSNPTLTEFDLPGILDIDNWWHNRSYYRSMIPVVGRHSRDDKMKWPANDDVLKTLYPVDGSFDVRIMGGSKSPLRVLGTKEVPTAWIVYKKDELPVPDFLYSLDYFVFYQHPQAIEAFGRAILEALASGTVVILPPHFKSVFGKAAVYAEPQDVPAVIRYLHSDFALYKEQITQAKRVLKEQFSYDSYSKNIEKLLTA